MSRTISIVVATALLVGLLAAGAWMVSRPSFADREADCKGRSDYVTRSSIEPGHTWINNECVRLDTTAHP